MSEKSVSGGMAAESGTWRPTRRACVSCGSPAHTQQHADGCVPTRTMPYNLRSPVNDEVIFPVSCLLVEEGASKLTLTAERKEQHGSTCLLLGAPRPGVRRPAVVVERVAEVVERAGAAAEMRRRLRRGHGPPAVRGARPRPACD